MRIKIRMRIPSSAVKPLVRLQLLFAEGSHPSSSLNSEWVALEMRRILMRMMLMMMMMVMMMETLRKEMAPIIFTQVRVGGAQDGDGDEEEHVKILKEMVMIIFNQIGEGGKVDEATS